MEKKIETPDATGILCKVEKHNKTQNRIRFDKNYAEIGEKIYVVSLQEYRQLTYEHLNKNISANQNNPETNNNQNQHHEDNKMIKQYKQELEDKNKKIHDLTTSINEKDAMLTDYKERIDSLGKELDNAITQPEYESLQHELDDAKTKLDYSEKSIMNLNESNISIVNENETLRKENNSINETNKLLNNNIVGLTATFESTKEQLIVDSQNKEKELKETIKKQQSHIDELTQKYESLLVLKEYIPQKQHYDELKQLQSKLNSIEKELETTKASITNKLAIQKSELDVEHTNIIHELKTKHTNEKAQMLVSYNNNINNLKHEKNNIILQYNDLLEDISTLTRINTLFYNKHKDIIKNRTAIELESLPTDQLTQSDATIEYVPKNENQE